MENKFLLVLLAISLTTTNSFTSDSVVRQSQNSAPKKIASASWEYSKAAFTKVVAGFAILKHATQEQVEDWKNALVKLRCKLGKIGKECNEDQCSKHKKQQIEILSKKINILLSKIENLKIEKEYQWGPKLKKLLKSLGELFIETLNFGISATNVLVKIINDILRLKIAPYLISASLGYFTINSSVIFWKEKIWGPVINFKDETCNSFAGKPVCLIAGKTFGLFKEIFLFDDKFADELLKHAEETNPEKFNIFKNNFGFASKAVLAAMIVTGIIIVIKKLASGKKGEKIKYVHSLE